LTIVKTALPEERVAPGGLFTFGLVITNTSAEAVTITALTDDVYGDLNRLTSATCSHAVGTTLTPAAAYSCTFTGELTGAVGAAQTDCRHRDRDRRRPQHRHGQGRRHDPPRRAGRDDHHDDHHPAHHAHHPRPASPATPSATTPARPELARTGSDLRRRTQEALALLGVGLLLTGLSWTRDARRRSPRAG